MHACMLPCVHPAMVDGQCMRLTTTDKLQSLELAPIRVIDGHVKLPGSKSLSNRILLLAALAEGTTTVENLLVRLPASTQSSASTDASDGLNALNWWFTPWQVLLLWLVLGGSSRETQA